MCLTGTGKSLTEKRRGLVYCIAVLAVNEKEGQDYAKYIIDYCTERSIFPLVELYQNQESFFEQIQKTVPAVVLLALPGVSGLNAACLLYTSTCPSGCVFFVPFFTELHYCIR